MEQKMNNYAILINTCDSFEDCWDPFFKLFSKYWPNFKGKIYLNTEYKDYNYPGLNIQAIQGCLVNNFPRDKRATWSQCLLWALELIDEDILLYMQEDYFIKDFVKDDLVENYVNLMHSDKNVHCVHVTDQSVISDGKSEIHDSLMKVKLKQRYRVCCQASLWQKSVLIEHIRPHESAWEFEEYGSKRSTIMQHNFYVVDGNLVKINQFEIIPYVFTGIVQGRWYEEVVPLFENSGIVVDFEKRGFIKDAPKRPIKLKIQYRLKKIPVELKSIIGILKLRLMNS